MEIILLSGGSGKRLWPLSNSTRANQYLSVLEDPRGKMESMLKRIWRQLGESDLLEYARISTCNEQQDIVRGQVGVKTPMIIEPEQRDTFPAVALAAAYLYSIACVSLSETIIIMPVNAYVESEFYSCIRGLPKALRECQSDSLMVGTRPSYPAKQYDYIVPERNYHDDFEEMNEHVVRLFKDKPYEDEAKLLYQQGALWNSGIYAFRLDFMITMLLEHGLPVHYDELYKQYNKMAKTSFEAEVTQKTSSRSVVCYEGKWKDLGTWKTFSEEIYLRQLS